MNASPDSTSTDPRIFFSYLMGLLTALMIFFLFVIFIAYKIGFSTMIDAIKSQIVPKTSSESVLDIPQGVLEELTSLRAVIGNANNPTHIPRHDTFLVEPDNDIGYHLRPNVQINVHLLKTKKAINVDPPVLHLLNKPNIQYSDDLKTYLNEYTRLKYQYSTNKNGFRRTLPYTKSDNTILVIGDSVCFGVGVDDENTVASHLQNLVGDQFRVTNAGVGGYSGQQAFLMAETLSNKEKYSGLIYIACQNDFMKSNDWVSEARNVLKNIKKIAPRFHDNIVVFLETYMEYNLSDFFLHEGWDEEDRKMTDRLRESLPNICAGLEFSYCDWTEIVQRVMEEEKSIFSRFALYSDHAHPSVLGNRRIAEKLFAVIRNQWTVNTDGTAEGAKP